MCAELAKCYTIITTFFMCFTTEQAIVQEAVAAEAAKSTGGKGAPAPAPKHVKLTSENWWIEKRKRKMEAKKKPKLVNPFFHMYSFQLIEERSFWKTFWKKVKLLKMRNFAFFHNVFYAICILKSFNSHISVVVCSFFEFRMVSKWCIREWVMYWLCKKKNMSEYQIFYMTFLTAICMKLLIYSA